MTIKSVHDSVDESDSDIAAVDPNLNHEESREMHFAKAMLRGAVFIGSFIERRFVPQLNDYRDVIKINDDETQVIANLKIVKSRFRKLYATKKWFGFTEDNCNGAPVGFNIWTKLREDVFGSYVFSVRKVLLSDDEIGFKLKILKPLPNVNVYSTPRRSVPSTSPARTISSPEESSNSSELSFESIKSTAYILGTEIKDFLSDIFRHIFTFRNIKEALLFLSLLLASLVTGFCKIIMYLLDYLLKLLDTLPKIITAITPTVIAITNMLTKIVGGFYLMVTLLWRDRHGPVNYVPAPAVRYSNPRPAIGYGQESYYRQKSRSSVTITPLD